ncbi:MAG: TrmH family RNA methyltransferase, partial [Pseudonocardiaceae bacterium]
GRQAVNEALRRGGARVVYATPEAAASNSEIVASADGAGVPIEWVTPQAAAALSETVTPQNLIAVCPYIDLTLEQVLSGSPRLIALLDRIQDPGNAGTVLRAADAAGADAVIFSDASVDPYNGTCVRASVGSVFHPAVVRGGDPAALIAELRGSGMQVLAADGHATQSLNELADRGELTGRTAWLLGNEASGIDARLLAGVDRTLRIPIYGQAESLNLALAAGLCLYASAAAQAG